MSDDHHAEEQEMEAEALAAIFDTHFGSLPNDDDMLYNHYWFIDIYPETASDPDELNKLNHVAIKLLVRIPKSYPEGDDDNDDNGNGSLPVLDIQLLKGLVIDPHQSQLLEIAQDEAQANQGVSCIYAIVERLREWLVEHNRPGLDDVSMHAQMIMRQQQQEKQKIKMAATASAAAAAQQGMEFESHLKHDQMSAAELEELAVRKRRAEGTPCNKENFEAWKKQFDAEMQALKEQEQAKDDAASGGGNKAAAAAAKKKAASASAGGGTTPATTTIDRSNRITGFDYFSDKATNLEALEAAAEQAEQDENASISGDEEDEQDNNNTQDYNEELFEDDVDLDDLDFDDDDDEEEDDDDDEPNI